MAGQQEEALTLLADQQKRLDASDAPLLKLELDFNHFINQERFKAHRQPDVLLRQLVSQVVEKGLWAPGEGLVPWLGRSARAKRLFAERTQRCLIRLDNSISNVGKGNSYFTVRYDDTTMVVTARMDGLTYTDGWGVKVDEQLGLHVLDEEYVAEAERALVDLQKKFEGEVARVHGAAVPVPVIEADWSSFVSSQQFLRMQDSARKSVVLNVVGQVAGKGLFDSSQGLVEWMAKSARARTTILSRVNRVVLACSPSSQVEPRKGCSYYQVRAKDGSLVVTARMDGLTYTDGWGPKVDEELDLNVLDEQNMKETIAKIKQHEAKLQAGLGGGAVQVLLEVDWASFVRSDKFRRMQDSARKSAIHNIADCLVERGLFDSNQGLLKWASGSKRVRRLLLERVNKIVIKLDPYGSLGDVGIGNSYYKVQEQAATAAGAGSSLVVTARLDSLTYTDGWGLKIDDQLGLHYLDETYMQQALQALAAKTDQLHGNLTSSMKPALRIDWDSFVSDGRFLRQRESARKSIFEHVVNTVIQKGIWDNDGLLAFCCEHPEVAIGTIVIKLTPDGSVNSGPGNSYYRVDVSDGPTVTVTVRMDSLTFTDGWKTKLNSQLATLKSVKTTAQAEISPHAYVADQPEPIPLPAATASDLHEYLVVAGEVSAPQVSEEQKLAREKAIADAKAKREAEEAKKAEEDARRDRKKREEEAEAAALRARQAGLGATSAASSAASPSTTRLLSPPVPSPSPSPSLSPSSPSPSPSPLGAAASLPGAQDALRQLQSAQSALNAALGGPAAAVEFVVDWSFAQDTAYTSLPPPQQKTCIGSNLATAMGSLSRGLVDLARDDTIKKEMLSGLVSRVVLAFDTSNSISSQITGSDSGRHYELTLRGGELRMRINFSKRSDTIWSMEDKLRCALNLQLKQSQAEMYNELGKIEKKLASAGLGVGLEVDWASFADSEAFLGQPPTSEGILLKDLKRQRDIIASLRQSYIQSVVTGTEGLVSLCQDDVFRAAVLERVKTIVFRLDPRDEVQADPSSSDYGRNWDLRLEPAAKRVVVTVNLSTYRNTVYRTKDKWDEAMQVRTVQGIRDAEKLLTSHQTALSNALGQTVQVKVDWAFTQHDSFLAKSLQERTKVCALATERCGNLVGSISGLTRYILCKHSLVSICNREPTSKSAIAGAVKAVVFEVDPTSAISDPIARCYSVVLSGPELRVAYNMDALDRPAYDFYEKLDALFELSIAKALRTVKPKLEALGQRLRSKGLAIEVSVDSARFKSSTEFLARPSHQKCELVTRLVEVCGQSLVEGSHLSIFDAYDSTPAARDWLKALVSRVVLAYDPTSSIYDCVDGSDQGKAYTLNLDDAGTLALTINMDDQWLSLGDLRSKLLAQLCFADARRGRYAPELSACAKRMEAAAGKAMELSFDWESLDTRAFLYANPLPTLQAHLLKAFADPAGLMGCLAYTVEQVCSTPMGKQAFAAAVESVEVTVGHHSAHAALVLHADDKRLEVTAMAHLCQTDALDTGAWRADLELALGQTVPIAKHCALQSLKQVEDEAASLMGKRVSVTIDWTHVDAPQTETGSDTIVAAGQRIHALGNALARRVMIQGLAAVCRHPVGQRTVHQSVDKVVLCYNPHPAHGSLIAIDAGAKTITVRTHNVAAAIHERFKELIEFDLDLVVRIAESNAQAQHDAAESAVSAAVGRPIKIEPELGFTSLDVFRRLPPAQQADIVTALCATLPERALASPEGLRGVVAHAMGKSAVAGAVDAVLFAADVEGNQPSKGSIVRDGRRLRVTLNLDEVLGAVQWKDWKARLADAVGVLLPIAQAEAQTALTGTAAQLSAALGKATMVQIGWEAFVATREWAALDAEAKLASVTALAGPLAQQALLGHQGLAGLTQFDSAKSALNQRAQSVQLALDPQATRVGVATNAGVLTLSFPLTGATNAESHMPSVRALVENALNLKPGIEAAVVQEVNEKVANAEKRVAAALGKPISIKIDWDALLQSELYTSTEDYVAFLRERIAPMPGVAFADGGESLESLLKDNPSARSAMQTKFAEVVLRVDTHSQCRPPQHRFVPQFYLAEAMGTTLVVTMRLNFGANRGCGPVLEWVLCPELAASREREEVSRIAAARKEAELRRRELELKRVQEKNAQAEKKHADKLQKYERDLKKYEKEKVEKHSHCKGTGWIACDNFWHRSRSPVTAKCTSCYGKGGRKCLPCKSTGLKFPKLEPPKPPQAPKTRPLPTFPPISSIDFTRDIA